MKFVFALLLSFTLVFSSIATPPANGDTRTIDNSSYSIPFRLSGLHFLLYYPSMYPLNTNLFGDFSRGGEGAQGWFQNEEEKWSLSIWVAHSNNVTASITHYKPADDNGNYDTNAQVQWFTNIQNAPQLFYNGTAVTNEGYNFPMKFQFLGAYPHDSSDGDSGEIMRDLVCQKLQIFYGNSPVPLWAVTWTNGWNTDQAGARMLGFSTGSHPYTGGFVAGSIVEHTYLGDDMNVGTLTVDYTALTSRTNHFTTSTITNTGNGVSFLTRAERMPPGWIEQTGTITNQGSMAFQVEPNLATNFTWTVNGTNFPNGPCTITLDGVTIGTTIASNGNFSFNLYTNMLGAWWTARTNVVNAFLDFYGCNHTTLIPHGAGSQGVLGVGDLVNYISTCNNQYDSLNKRGATFVSAMSAQVAQLEQYDAAIYTVAQQTTHLMTITFQAPSQPAPFR